MVVTSTAAAAISGSSAHRERASNARQGRDQPSIMLVSKSPLPAFSIPYPQPPAATRVADLRRAILEVYAPTKPDRTTVTYSEQLRLTTLTNWRLGMITLDLHQNALIDPATREAAVQQVGYRLEDDHECGLIEDGDEIHVGLKDGCDVSELQLPKLGSSHVYSAPANLVSLTRKGTISKPPPYSLLPPSEPSSHSSSIAAQPNANYHSHNHASDWRSPFRVLTASKSGPSAVRRDSSGTSGAIGTSSGPTNSASAQRQMPRASTSTAIKNQMKRRSTQQATGSEVRAPPMTHHHSSGAVTESLPTYTAGAEVLNLPPTARVIGLGVQGTAGNARKRESRQNSYSSGAALGTAAATSSTPTATGRPGMSVPGVEGARPKEGLKSEEQRSREPSGPSRNANGAGTRRSSGASRDLKTALSQASRPGFIKHSSSGYQSYTSNASHSNPVTATATAAFLSSPVSVSTPPIVNLSPFPELSVVGEDTSKGSTSGHTPAQVSAAMLKHLRRARNSFIAAPMGESSDLASSADYNKTGVIRLATPPDEEVPEDSTGEDAECGETGVTEGKEGDTKLALRLKKGKGKSKAVEKDKDPSEEAAQRADKRYRDVRATLEREIAKQALADEARAAQYAEEQARREEEQRKKEEEHRRQVTREKWELWEEVKKREKKEMKERKRRGEDVPEEAPLGPTGAEIV
ncbi:hypothetical protein A4X09_0g1224 [Tilletia walkeri]|uniref:Uncharacterized protein n=1 Tax=Tilletia walkeri TaxID=117179 RepID=A0A8X7NES0_9BASI|nr:hypothetical protein A4X09_0g1224 [Tilletia walkeri]